MCSDRTGLPENETAIRVRGVSKTFQIYHRPHHRLLQGIFGQRRRFFDEFSALRDVSFDVGRGEVIGITGRNGSGKSTLLQIICGTMLATTGEIEVNGRIAALLELGTGFNPEFTGRENVYVNSAILGLSSAETTARFDAIADFAEIGEFIDQPVKTYSSGMMVRLAFAIAINVDPEILVVDEALSVGDERFQRKCFSRIEEIRRGGATILFVSHAASTIIELCDRAVLLDGGELLATGTPKTVIGYYQKLLYAQEDQAEGIRQRIRDADRITTEPASPEPSGLRQDSEPAEILESYDPALKPTSTIEYESLGARIESPAILTLSGIQVNHLVRRRRYRYRFTVTFSEEARQVRFGMLIRSLTGVDLGGGASAPSSSRGIPVIDAGVSITIEFEFECNLNPGVYFLNAGILGEREGEEVFLHRCLDIAMFRVLAETDLVTTGPVDFGCIATVTFNPSSSGAQST